MSRYTAGELRRIDAYANFWMTREDAETVSCDGCHASAGQTCVNPRTGEPFRGPAHWQRIRKVEKG